MLGRKNPGGACEVDLASTRVLVVIVFTRDVDFGGRKDC